MVGWWLVLPNSPVAVDRYESGNQLIRQCGGNLGVRVEVRRHNIRDAGGRRGEGGRAKGQGRGSESRVRAKGSGPGIAPSTRPLHTNLQCSQCREPVHRVRHELPRLHDLILLSVGLHLVESGARHAHLVDLKLGLNPQPAWD